MELINANHTPHDTRHTCISMLTEKDVSPTYIKMIVGHSGAMSLTERVYTHIDIAELLKAINKI
jgi:integrase